MRGDVCEVMWRSAAIGGVLLIPVPIFIEAPFTLQPRDTRYVLSTLPGRIDQALVQPEDVVDDGQNLLVPVNEAQENCLRELQQQLTAEHAKLEISQNLGSRAEKTDMTVRRYALSRR